MSACCRRNIFLCALLLGSGAAGAEQGRIKLDAAGRPLAEQSAAWNSRPNAWQCVADSATGLVWEVKADDGVRHKDRRYRWSAQQSPAASCADCDADSTADYVAALNRLDNGAGKPQGLCGFRDWRLPGRAELLTLMEPARLAPAADTSLFPTLEPAPYWTATRFAGDAQQAWSIDFQFGLSAAADTGRALRVMLVRGGR